jgi:hypothetical protein
METEHDLNFLLDSDAIKHYPENDPSGYYTTVDIIRIFPEIKMETIQDWIKRGFILPVYITEIGLGKKKWFNRSQVCLIGLFKKLIDLGVKREMAKPYSRAMLNLRKSLFEDEGKETDFFIIELESKIINVKTIRAWTGEIKIKKNLGDIDIVIINFYKILNKIDSYTK